MKPLAWLVLNSRVNTTSLFCNIRVTAAMTKLCSSATVACLVWFTTAVNGAGPSTGLDSTRSREIWAAAPPMHHARAAHAVVATSNAIYALAGTGDKNGGPDAFVWDANQSRDVFRWRRGIPTFRRSRGDAFA